jgi:hypothetical protein
LKNHTTGVVDVLYMIVADQYCCDPVDEGCRL